MMNFIVPQFIDVEDKIFANISVRQFIMLIVGAGLLFAAYRFADLSLFLVEAFFIATLTLAFTFLKVNGRPFHYFLLNLVQTLRRPRLRMWRTVSPDMAMRKTVVTAREKHATLTKPPLTKSRLAELSLVVDTGGAYKDEGINES